MSIQVGFLGAGFISGFHVTCLAGSRVEHRIVAVHDPDFDRARAFAARHGAVVMSEDDLIGAVDAVYVTTWTSEHPRLVDKVAAAGKAVFCEKPLAVSAPLVDEMVATVAAAGVINQVGLVLRFLGPARLVRHLLADERAGRVLAVVFRDDQYIPIQGLYGSDWRIDRARAGRGTMIEHSIHDVDLLRWWLGPIEAVSASTRSVHGHAGIEDVAAARMDFASGAVATLVSVWHDILERPSARHIELFCERLHIVIENELFGPVRYQFNGEPAVTLEGRALTDALAAFGDAPANSADAFLRAIELGEPADPSFAAAVPAHRVVDAIYESADAGGELVRNAELA